MLKEPTSVNECVYFTNRTLKESGKIIAWVFREKCQKCNNALMGKPRDERGKIKIRAKEYTCPSCNFTMQEKEYEDTLTCNIKYICPYCGNSDEAQVPFKRKKIMVANEETGKKTSLDVIRFQCRKCSKNIDISKKLKGI